MHYIALKQAMTMRNYALQPHEIRHLRRTLGMTQVQFGAMFNRNAATIFRWENGIYQPDPAASAALVKLWNDVFPRYNTVQKRQSDEFAAFVTGLIAGGIFAYLLFGGKGTSNGDEEE